MDANLALFFQGIGMACTALVLAYLLVWFFCLTVEFFSS